MGAWEHGKKGKRNAFTVCQACLGTASKASWVWNSKIGKGIYTHCKCGEPWPAAGGPLGARAAAPVEAGPAAAEATLAKAVAQLSELVGKLEASGVG